MKYMSVKMLYKHINFNHWKNKISYNRPIS